MGDTDGDSGIFKRYLFGIGCKVSIPKIFGIERKVSTGHSKHNINRRCNKRCVEVAMIHKKLVLLDDLHKLEMKKITESIIQQRDKHDLEIKRLEVEIEILYMKKDLLKNMLNKKEN